MATPGNAGGYALAPAGAGCRFLLDIVGSHLEGGHPVVLRTQFRPESHIAGSQGGTVLLLVLETTAALIVISAAFGPGGYECEYEFECEWEYAYGCKGGGHV